MSRFNTDRLRLELQRARRPFLQYLFLIGVAAFCLTIILKNQFYERPWEGHYKFKAAFTDVKGVTPGVQKVRIAGVDAGVVAKSKVKDGQAQLTISLKDEYGPIYRDAKLRLRPLTPLQDMYLSIDDRGSKAAGELDKNEVLPAGRTISPVDISRVLNNFQPTTRRRMQVLLDQFGRGLEDNGLGIRLAFAELAPFLDAARETSEIVADRRKDMAGVVTNLRLITEALGQRDQQISSLVSDGSATVSELAAADEGISGTLRELPPTLDGLRTSLATFRRSQDRLDPALKALGPVADELESGLEGLEDVSKDLTPALADLRPAARDLAPLARDLRPTANDLAGAFAALRPQAPRFERILRQIPPCEKQVSGFFNDTLSIFKFYDENGAFPRGDDGQDADTFGGVSKAVGLKRSPSCTPKGGGG